LVGLATLAVYFTGEPAEDAIKHLTGFEESLVEAHEDTALYGLILAEVLAVLGVAALYLKNRSSQANSMLIRVSIALSLLNTGLMAYTANLGGKIRHTEIRATPTEAPN
jgi:hypothetical protein